MIPGDNTGCRNQHRPDGGAMANPDMALSYSLGLNILIDLNAAGHPDFSVTW